MRIFLKRWTDISTGVFVDMLKMGNIYEVLHMKVYQLYDRKVTRWQRVLHAAPWLSSSRNQ